MCNCSQINRRTIKQNKCNKKIKKINFFNKLYENFYSNNIIKFLLFEYFVYIQISTNKINAIFYLCSLSLPKKSMNLIHRKY